MQSFNDCWWFKDLNKIFMIKETKDLKNLADYCVKKSKIYGATGCGVYVGNNISETVNFRNKKIENSDRSDILLINITTYVGKKKSSSSFTYIDKNNTDKMIEKCVDVTKLLPEDESRLVWSTTIILVLGTTNRVLILIRTIDLVLVLLLILVLVLALVLVQVIILIQILGLGLRTNTSTSTDASTSTSTRY